MPERKEVMLTGIRIPHVRQGTRVLSTGGELSMVSESGSRLIEAGEPVPEIPEDMVGVRFHGRLAVIPRREDGEESVGGSSFTQKQVDALRQLQRLMMGQLGEAWTNTSSVLGGEL